MQKANQMLERLSARYENVHYIDIVSSIMNEFGEPDNGLFVKDRLHLNEEGYKAISIPIQQEISK